MKVLLHICCAPCSIYIINQCRDVARNVSTDSVNKIKGFYFNPNIHPYQEYLKRRQAVEQHTKMLNSDRMFEVIFPEYDPEEFFRKINCNETKPVRCRLCWQMRLTETALFARANGFDAFSTTLLISPYQDHLIIRELGEELAKKFDLKFYYQDFRTGFRGSQDEARKHNLYRQKYCGCVYSEIERFTSTRHCEEPRFIGATKQSPKNVGP